VLKNMNSGIHVMIFCDVGNARAKKITTFLGLLKYELERDIFISR
jgi:hypothetical protein